jgi:symplekin
MDADLYSDPNNPLAPRIHQYVERNMRTRNDIFDEASRKRGPPEPTDGLDPAKRQRLAANIPNAPQQRVHIPPLTPGPHTIAELFTVTDDEALKAFDVGILPAELVVKIGATILSKLDSAVFNQTLNVSLAWILDKPQGY